MKYVFMIGWLTIEVTRKENFFLFWTSSVQAFGNLNNGDPYGPFCLNANNALSNSNWNIGARAAFCGLPFLYRGLNIAKIPKLVSVVGYSHTMLTVSHVSWKSLHLFNATCTFMYEILGSE